MSTLPGLDKDNEEQHIFLHVMVIGFHHLKGPITEFCYPELPQFPVKEHDERVKNKEAATDKNPEKGSNDIEYESKDTENESKDTETVLPKEKAPVSETESVASEDDMTLPQLPSEWAFLPFAALPDGSHQRNTGSSFFTLPAVEGGPQVYQQTLFGISKFRQIETEKVLNRTKDMSRTFIQKAIVVVARMPAIGPINEKISQVTEAYFNQLDFSDLSIFKDFYSSLINLMGQSIPDDLFYSGLPLPEFVALFREKSLVLVKLLLLQRKVLFYGSTMETVGKFQFALLCLIGDISRYLNHSSDPLAEHLELVQRNHELETSTSIQDMVNGFNPPLFGKGCAFQPCLTLQQVDLFMSSPDVRSFLIGSTNQLFEVKDDFYDVRVNVDSGDIFFLEPQLEELLRLSSADFKFMSGICESVRKLETLETDSSSGFAGSSTHIRLGFITYYQALAASVLHSQSLKLHAKDNIALKEEFQDRVAEILEEFNLDWVNAWARTPNFRALISLINSESVLPLDSESLGHPGHGATIFDSIQIKLASQIKNIRIEQNLAPVVESLGKAGGKISQAFSGIYADIQKSVDRKVSTEGASDLSQKIVTGFSSWFSTAKSKVSSHLEQLEETFSDKGTKVSEEPEKDAQKGATEPHPINKETQECITSEPTPKEITGSLQEKPEPKNHIVIEKHHNQNSHPNDINSEKSPSPEPNPVANDVLTNQIDSIQNKAQEVNEDHIESSQENTVDQVESNSSGADLPEKNVQKD